MQKYSDIDILNHDIRTPLVGLLSMLDELGHEALNPYQKGCLKDIHTASQKLLSATVNLLKNKQAPISKAVSEKSTPSITNQEKSEKKWALLVEDNVLVQNAHTAILEALGYQVHSAMTGKKALKLYEKHHYDMALVDVGLPDMSGIDVVRAMHTYQRDAKIIVVTAYVSDAVIGSCREAGSHLVLNKPLIAENFKMQLDGLMAEK
jgi:CheY-like chemotaxis protein